MQLIGQSLNLEIINRWQELPNFIIIQGDRHTGKTHLATYLCEKFGKHYVAMKNGIADIRGLLNIMVENSNAVYHFKDFDKASIQAKNALLKVTEETPKGNTIIITGSSQIGTLESRAIKIVMSAYTADEMVEYLNKYYLPDVSARLFKAGIDTPAKCMHYKSYDGVENVLNYAYSIYESLSYISIDSLIVMLSKFEYKYDGVDPCLLFIEMLINIIEYNIKNNLNYRYSYHNVLDLLVECKEDLLRDTTLNRKLLLYRTFYQIQLLGGKL